VVVIDSLSRRALLSTIPRGNEGHSPGINAAGFGKLERNTPLKLRLDGAPGDPDYWDMGYSR
jgi:hypothetical protein